mgnify:CR=1 FL=1
MQLVDGIGRGQVGHSNVNHHLEYPGGFGRVSDVALARVAPQLSASPAPFAIGFGAGKQPDGRQLFQAEAPEKRGVVAAIGAPWRL